MIDLSGKQIKGYELRKLIGQGGFGSVYTAYQPLLDRQVAIKVIHPRYANHPEFIRQFEAEAQLVARLESLHIVPLYDYWRDPAGAYLVMRFFRGGNLRQQLIRGPWELPAIARLLDQIAAALTVAHRNGVVHQDVKPSNILADEDGNAYLSDFGIAKVVVEQHDSAEETISFGSPPYMSPEAIMRQPITHQADIYSLGIVLYELLTGRVPFIAPNTTAIIQKHINDPVPPLQFIHPDLPQALNLVMRRATAKAPDARYPDAVSLARDFRQVTGLGQMSSSILPVSLPDSLPEEVVSPERTAQFGEDESETLVLEAALKPDNPYKGLRPFEEADAPNFFGREKLIERLVNHLSGDGLRARFLAVVGPSGSGKSSVVHAGLLPALREGHVPKANRWFIVKLTPGDDPFGKLETALLGIALDPPPGLGDLLRADAHGLLRAVQQVMPDKKADLLLVVDQFEELFTQGDDESARALLLDSLAVALNDPESCLRVIITLRADFYDRPLLYPAFGDLLSESTEVVLPFTADELVRAIVRPAERVGLTVEKDLAAAMVAHVTEQPGALPLLQYSLTELFDLREGMTLTKRAYQASGGVVGALARRADDLYGQLDAGNQAAVRPLFLRLVAFGEDGERTRRRVRWAELTAVGEGSATVREVLNLFSKHRLLTFDHDPQTREPTVEIAHEALIERWDRLREWLDDSQEDLLVHRRLAAATLDWVRAKGESSYLATGARLGQFERLAESSVLALNEFELSYLAASIGLRQQLERRQRRFVAALVIFSIIAFIFAIFALDRENRATLARHEAERQAAISRSRELAITGLSNLDQPDLALLLSQEALNAADTFAARNSLLTILESYPDLERYLHGHSDRVASLAFSPDGRLLASGSWDGSIVLWEASTGRPLDRLTGHADAVTDLAFSPDGRLLASASFDWQVRLWPLSAAGEVQPSGVRILEGHTDWVSAVAFSPDGAQLASAGYDGLILLWTLTAEPLRSRRLADFSQHDFPEIFCLAFSPDGRLLVAGGNDGQFRFWDARTGQSSGDAIQHDQSIIGLAFSPNGLLLAAGDNNGEILLWELASREPIARLAASAPVFQQDQYSNVYDLAFSPDGRYLLSGGQDRTARLWDVATFQEIRVLTAHRSQVTSAAFCPQGACLATGDGDGTIIIWQAEALPLEARQLTGHEHPVSSVAFSPDGQRLASASSDALLSAGNTVRLWDASTGENLAVFVGQEGAVSDIAISPDGRWLAAGYASSAVSVWSLPATGAVTLDRPAHILTGHTNAVRSLDFSPDGRWLATGDDDGVIRRWDTATWEAGDAPLAGMGSLRAVAFSPDGRLLASGGMDAVVRLWDVAAGRLIGEPLAAHDGPVMSLAFSPDGERLVSGSRDSTIIVWDLAARQVVFRSSAQHGWVTALAFNPAGGILASGDEWGGVTLWDGETWRALGLPLAAQTDTVWSLAFSPDGQTLAAGSHDTTITLWTVDAASWEAAPCRIANRNFTAAEWARYFPATPFRETCPGLAPPS